MYSFQLECKQYIACDFIHSNGLFSITYTSRPLSSSPSQNPMEGKVREGPLAFSSNAF